MLISPPKQRVTSRKLGSCLSSWSTRSGVRLRTPPMSSSFSNEQPTTRLGSEAGQIQVRHWREMGAVLPDRVTSSPDRVTSSTYTRQGHRRIPAKVIDIYLFRPPPYTRQGYQRKPATAIDVYPPRPSTYTRQGHRRIPASDPDAYLLSPPPHTRSSLRCIPPRPSTYTRSVPRRIANGNMANIMDFDLFCFYEAENILFHFNTLKPFSGVKDDGERVFPHQTTVNVQN